MPLAELLDKVKVYLDGDALPRIEQAYEFARRCHEGQVRLSGGPFLEHPLETAVTVADLRLDVTSIVAALLHDVPEDCHVALDDIQAQFGPEVRRLVDGVTKLGRIGLPGGDKKKEEAEAHVESLRKMLVAMAEDIRVVLIKLSDRLHNMRTLDALPAEDRRRIARETMDIYAPLAHRLGIASVQGQLEDLAFRFLDPDRYYETANLVASRREEREEYVALIIQQVQQEMAKQGVKAEISGRAKHLFSTYQKKRKYEIQGRDFSEIFDLLAVRILVDKVSDCYSALGAVHNLWPPIPNTFDDYIAAPKENMYQSLHTTVLGPQARPLEIQIRTHDMHETSEYGVAAHWKYKEGRPHDMRFEEKMAWMRQLLEWHRDLSGSDFLQSVKTDVFADQVFVYTPKGDIKQLPAGSTPLDFAYRIHTDLGHRCIGGRVNGRLVPLNYKLQNGDTVEILAAKTARGPSRDWLNTNMGYLGTSDALSKVRQWFRRQARTENIHQGKAILEKEMRRLGLAKAEELRILGLFKYDTMEDFLLALGSGEVDPHQISVKLAALEPAPPPVVSPKPDTSPAAVEVLGVGDLLTQMARCCNPVPGDDIVGFITRSRGVTVHRRDCASVLHEDEKERLVKVDWGRAGRTYRVPVLVEAWDQLGLLRDISTVVSEERVNIASVSSVEHPEDGTISLYLSLDITGVGQLTRVMSRLEGVRGALRVERVTEGSKARSDGSP